MSYKHSQLTGVSFSLYSAEEIQKNAVVELTMPVTYDERGLLVAKGVLDPRMGVSSPGQFCETCQADCTTCHGHTGFINLAYPVLNSEYIDLIDAIIRVTCECGHVTSGHHCNNCDKGPVQYTFIKPYYFKAGDRELSNEEILQRFKKVDPVLLRALPRFKNLRIDPTRLIITALPVLPVISRPSLILPGSRHAEDPLSHKYIDIIRANSKLKKLKEQEGALLSPILHFGELLQYHVATLFNNTHSNIPVATSKLGTPIKSIAQKIKGKQGRFRQNLAGKRIDHSARAVVSPDFDIQPGDIALPVQIMRSLTKRDVIHKYNLQYLKRLFWNNPAYPCVTHLLVQGKRLRVTESTRELLAQYLVVGNEVQRTLDGGDYVLVNRHPSLHRFSLLCHRVRQSKGPTIGLHPAAAPGYNADFDGDEMNVHAVQDVPTMVEASEVMSLAENIVSDKSGHVLVALTKDVVAGAYLLSLRTIPFKYSQTLHILAGTGLKASRGLNGREILSLVLPTDLNYDNELGVVIKNGQLLSGVLTGPELGVESTLFTKIYRLMGGRAYLELIHKISKICLATLSITGLTYTISYQMMSYRQRYPQGSQKDFRNYVLTTCKKEGSVIMAESKAAGSMVNLVTTFFKLGTQSVPSYTMLRNHTDLVAFETYAESIEKGFARGLTNSEYFLQTMAGRLALVDVFCRTAATGYTSRKLNNCLQSIIIAKDGSLRDSSDRIIQLSYGGDGIEPKMIDYAEPFVNLTRLIPPENGIRGNKQSLRKTISNSRLGQETTAVFREGFLNYASQNGISAATLLQNEETLIGLEKEYKVPFSTPIGLITAQALTEPLTQMTLHRRHDVSQAKSDTMASAFERINQQFMNSSVLKTPFVKITFDSSNVHRLREIAEAVKSVNLSNVSEFAVDWSSLAIQVTVDDSKLEQQRVSMRDILVKLKRLTGVNLVVENNVITLTLIQPTLIKLNSVYERLNTTLLRCKRRTKSVYEQELAGGLTALYVVDGDYQHIAKILESYPQQYTLDTNQVSKVLDCYGIPTAKVYLLRQLESILTSQGLTVDRKHFTLIIDTMFHTGQLKGLNRSGVMMQTNSVLARAAFETANKVLMKAAVMQQKDELRGLFEATIVGKYAKAGAERINLKLVDTTKDLQYHL